MSCPENLNRWGDRYTYHGGGGDLIKDVHFYQLQEVEHGFITEMASVIIRFVVSDNLTLSFSPDHKYSIRKFLTSFHYNVLSFPVN